MSTERARDLACHCTELVREGNDFPTVWNQMLKGNTLVDSLPQSIRDGTRFLLGVRLVTGERLVFDGDGKKFSVQ